MFTKRQSAGLLLTMITGILSGGCFSNKNKNVADAPPQQAPPPAAYPESSSGYSGGGTPPSINPVYGTASPAPPAASPEPVPFQLREGEQLVTHMIESGETLSSIAAKYSSTIGRIQSANGMTGTAIFAGKTLQVPTSAMPGGLAMNAATASPNGNPANQGAGQPLQSYPGQSVAPAPAQIPGYPAATSYPPVQSAPAGAPSGGGTFPTPSLQGSGIQFSN